MATPRELPAPVMQQIRARIASGAGLEPPPWVLEARVAERMQKLGMLDAGSYAEQLANRTELSALVELLRVGETSFFRHLNQLRALEEIVIPALLANSGPVRVWSAGCASGEEPYTLAMLLSKSLAGKRKLSILASDISGESVRGAREAIYSAVACQSVPAPYRPSLDRLDEQRFQVTARIRGLVEFEERNLSLGPYPSGFDLILCRNVLIYFAPDARRAALKRLVLSLRPGAFLFLGYSESLRDVDGLEPVLANDATVYRRSGVTSENTSRNRAPRTSSSPAPRTSPVLTPGPDAFVRAESPTDASAHSAHDTKPRVCLQGEYLDAIRISKELRLALERPGIRTLVIDLDGADFLGDQAALVIRKMQISARAMNIDLRCEAKREGHLRFLRRHELLMESRPGGKSS